MKNWIIVKIASVLCLFIMLFTGCVSTEGFSASVAGMGTVISAKIYGENGDSAFEHILKIFDEIENACSLTKEASAINKLNETGSTNNVYLVEQARIMKELTEKSQGKFDCTVGSITSLWNIGFADAKKPKNEEIQNALNLVDASITSVTDGMFKISIGQKVDFGATTKGYALDKAKEILEINKVGGAVITVGGSVLFFGKNPQNKDWVCAVKDPFDLNKYLGTFNIKEGFVSTSGSYERFFEEDGTVYHHIIDAQTGYPCETQVVSVTVICNNGLMSDALSTVCFMVGVEEGQKLLNEYGAQGIFVEKDGNITVVGDIDFEKTVY